MEVVFSTKFLMPNRPGHGVVIHGTFWNGFLVQEWILVCLNKTAVPTKRSHGFPTVGNPRVNLFG